MLNILIEKFLIAQTVDYQSFTVLFYFHETVNFFDSLGMLCYQWFSLSGVKNSYNIPLFNKKNKPKMVDIKSFLLIGIGFASLIPDENFGGKP